MMIMATMMMRTITTMMMMMSTCPFIGWQWSTKGPTHSNAWPRLILNIIIIIISLILLLIIIIIVINISFVVTVIKILITRHLLHNLLFSFGPRLSQAS